MDNDFEKEKEWFDEKEINWRSFLNVESWFGHADPYFFVIDASGKVRFHGNFKKSARAVEELMSEMGKDVNIVMD